MFRKFAKRESPAAVPAKHSRARRIVDWTGRLLLVIAIAWLATSTVATFNRLQSSSAGPSMDEPATALNDQLPGQFVLADLLGGGWTLEGLPLEVAIHSLSQQELGQRWNAIAAGLPPVDAEATARFDIESFFRTLGGSARRQGEYQVQELSRSDLRAAAYRRASGDETQLCLVRLAWPLPSGEWKLLEARAAPHRMVTSISTEQLLPLVGTAQTVAQRRDARGRLVGQVSLADDLEAQLAAWRAAGYALAPAPGMTNDAPQYLCTRGGDTIYAWLHRDSDKPSGVIILVRTPDP